MGVTEGIRVTWEERWFVVVFVDQIWMLADGYNARPRDHSYMPLLHTLNMTKIDDIIIVRIVSTILTLYCATKYFRNVLCLRRWVQMES